VATQAQEVTEPMFLAAARTLAHTVSEDDLARGSLFPALPTIREVSAKIAAAVARVAVAEGLANEPVPEDAEQWVRDQMWWPEYS
jgi:malate dehydrogenase (oxaloacetate-decarboxylating)(NADP+)